MALAPGQARKDLSADALFGSLRSRFASLPDPRSGEVEIPLDDALMSAFAMFSLKDPSLLAFDDPRHDPVLPHHRMLPRIAPLGTPVESWRSYPSE